MATAQEPKNVVISVAVPLWLRDKLEEQSRERMTSKSSVIREVLAGHLRSKSNAASTASEDGK